MRLFVEGHAATPVHTAALRMLLEGAAARGAVGLEALVRHLGHDLGGEDPRRGTATIAV
jgi:hypothetical protein